MTRSGGALKMAISKKALYGSQDDDSPANRWTDETDKTLLIRTGIYCRLYRLAKGHRILQYKLMLPCLPQFGCNFKETF